MESYQGLVGADTKETRVVFTVRSVPRIGARSLGESPKGRIPDIISMEAVMDPAGVPNVCFIRNMMRTGSRYWRYADSD
jgi:hypothetical protein